MDDNKRQLIQSYLEKYLISKIPEFKVNRKGYFECPFKDEHETVDEMPSCKIYSKPSVIFKCFNPAHNKSYNIFDVAKKLENGMEEFEDHELGEYLIELLDIQTNEEEEKVLQRYLESGFNLIPLQCGHKDTKEKPKGADRNKAPIGGVSWKESMSSDIKQWKEWRNANLNLGLVLGKVSQTVALDIDSQETLKKMTDLVQGTLTQSTSRGFHYLYQYEEWMDGINHENLRKSGYEMELRANNSYIVVAPSLVRKKREWNNKKMIKMPEDLKNLLLSLIEKKTDKDDEGEKLQFKELKGDLKGLDGCCNETFVQLGGILRKKAPAKTVEHALLNFNKLLANPMEYKDIKSMMWQISRYNKYDQKELADQVLEHLHLVEQSTPRDLQASLLHDKKDIEEVLKYLIDDGKVIKTKNIYRVVNEVEWEEDFMKVSKPLPFDVPYLEKFNKFANGSMVILGAVSGRGKTHIAVNFLEQFVKQGIYPRLLSTEATAGFGEISAYRGLVVGDFGFKIVKDPTTVELVDNGVTIIDWLSAPESDYSRMQCIYERLNEQLRKHGGLLIVLCQLKTETNGFYAEDMTKFYGSFVGKYLWTPIKSSTGSIIDYDSVNTYIQSVKMRASKVGKQYIKIPMKYNSKTKEITLRGNQ